MRLAVSVACLAGSLVLFWWWNMTMVGLSFWRTAGLLVAIAFWNEVYSRARAWLAAPARHACYVDLCEQPAVGSIAKHGRKKLYFCVRHADHALERAQVW